MLKLSDAERKRLVELRVDGARVVELDLNDKLDNALSATIGDTYLEFAEWVSDDLLLSLYLVGDDGYGFYVLRRG
jgi:hypothetical protein